MNENHQTELVEFSKNSNHQNDPSFVMSLGSLEQEDGLFRSSSSIASDGGDDDMTHKTTARQSLVHLCKGYIGPGCLSLPWAVSQVGIGPGCLAIICVAVWASYNCWTIVRLKRKYMQATEHHSSSVTYPDIGQWLYGTRFASFVTTMICIQQLAICTVFMSFCGANLQAVLASVWELPVSHIAVITMALPAILALSCLPDLKALAPVTAAGTALLLLGLGLMGVVICMEWNNPTSTTTNASPSSIPLALCAILYSFEGINLILPIESAMQQPRQFGPIFCRGMTITALTFCTVAGFCVAAFGNVTSGSVTAFLLQLYKDDDSILRSLVLAANAAVSLSVLVTYPLQLFPCLQLIAPLFASRQRRDFHSIANQDDDDDNPDHVDDHALELDQDDGYETASTTETMSSTDSAKARVSLVALTYIVAIAVPNVHSLISLAGALAGSSTALLIPPLLELAWLRRCSDVQWPLLSFARSGVLLLGGLVFLCIGTGASIIDIVQDYTKHDPDRS